MKILKFVKASLSMGDLLQRTDLKNVLGGSNGYSGCYRCFCANGKFILTLDPENEGRNYCLEEGGGQMTQCRELAEDLC